MTALFNSIPAYIALAGVCLILLGLAIGAAITSRRKDCGFHSKPEPIEHFPEGWEP